MPTPRIFTPTTLSAAIRRGLIEATITPPASPAECCYPRRFAAASLKPPARSRRRPESSSYPRRFAAASLKRPALCSGGGRGSKLSAAIRRGLIEACSRGGRPRRCRALSAAIRRGLIEALRCLRCHPPHCCYPRRFAAASLKRMTPALQTRACASLSAAIRRGLIEAWEKASCVEGVSRGYPRRFAAASLKLRELPRLRPEHDVIRGDSPRPH